MSHFSVLVVGNDIEKALAPYDENLEMPRRRTGEVTMEDKIRFVGYYTDMDDEEVIKNKMEENPKFFEELYLEHGDSWNGREWEKASDGTTWHEYSTYNPDSKWDWYQVGGRWAGKLLIKDEFVGNHEVSSPSLLFEDRTKLEIMADSKRADSALVKEVDWDLMSKKVKDHREATYNKFVEAIENPVKRETIHPYFDYGVRSVEVSPEEFEKNKDNPTYFENKDGNVSFRYQTREEYVGTGKFSTYALLMDGQWYQKGEMGWFGMSKNEMDEEEWDETFQDKIKSLDPETRITVVDCHI
jgi:hypothetical protein